MFAADDGTVASRRRQCSKTVIRRCSLSMAMLVTVVRRQSKTSIQYSDTMTKLMFAHSQFVKVLRWSLVSIRCPKVRLCRGDDIMRCRPKRCHICKLVWYDDVNQQYSWMSSYTRLLRERWRSLSRWTLSLNVDAGADVVCHIEEDWSSGMYATDVYQQSKYVPQ